MRNEGYIETIHVLHCKCGHSERMPNVMTPMDEVIEGMGWKHDKTYGYLCPTCSTSDQKSGQSSAERIAALEELHQTVKAYAVGWGRSKGGTFYQDEGVEGPAEPVLKALEKLAHLTEVEKSK